jgi:hypothetical protein
MSSELTSDRVPPAHIGSGDSLDSVMEPPVRYYEGKAEPLDKQLASVQGAQILGCHITQPMPPTGSIGRDVDRKFSGGRNWFENQPRRYWKTNQCTKLCCLRNSSIRLAISSPCVSSAKWPVSNKCVSTSFRSRG